MKEQLISFETAVLAKKNNVEIESYEFYTHRGDLCKDQNFRNQSQYYGSYGAYKQTLLQEWFEKVHGKTIIIDLDSFLFNGKCDFKFYIYQKEGNDVRQLNDYKLSSVQGTYEEALEKGLQEAFKYINK